MTGPPIRFSTDILRRLGEELNPNLDQGILELVKNSYDADARSCAVRMLGVLSARGSIEVEDDGDGLEYDDIVEGWLVLGRSRKSSQTRTRLGRTPAGNKGLGRLAALRLGQQVRLITRPRGSTVEYTVSIDWRRYDKSDLVEDVPVDIQRSEHDGSQFGTRVVIEDLHSKIGRVEAKRLARAMILLADPFDTGPTAFRPVLESQDFSDLEKLVRGMYFDDAEFHLRATLTGGRARAEVSDWRGGLLYSGEHDDLAGASAGSSYKAPDTTFDFWVFILNRVGFAARATSLAEVRSWIENFGGVHIYLNGLRVAPYGNAGNDWLDINLRRVQNPEERPGTNTAIGRVSVHDGDAELKQKTDRSGFIEDAVFEELRRFCQDALEWLARERLQSAERRRRTERTTTTSRAEDSRANVRMEIEKAPDAVKSDLTRAFQEYDRERQRETDALRKEVQLYRTLSTAGITAATFAHESGGYPLKIIGQSINAIEFRGKKLLDDDVYEDKLAKPVESIRHASDSLGVLSSATLRLVDYDKRRMGRVELNAVVHEVLRTFEPLLSGRDVKVEIALTNREPYIRGTEAAVESILTNFINNSLAAFQESSSPERILRISTSIEDKTWRLRFSDNGPGVAGAMAREIWLPGNTTRVNGTGLGLTIVRDAVSDLRGEVSLENMSELGGASFTVSLPILGVSP